MAFESKNTAASLLPGVTSGLELTYPARAVEPPAWLGHIPFAHWIIEALRPRMIVELGVHTGNSYCAFLEAVHTLGLDTRCFGIDHWKGDEHAGHYGEEVYEKLRDHHDTRYGSFSTLLRSSFDDALSYFADSSIDLLHIDGFHTYEAVSADFKAWLPKLGPQAVVLFHDINVRDRGFGIWRFWEELASNHPHFEFIHSHGLGVAYVGSEHLTGAIGELFAAKGHVTQERVHRYFARLGVSIVDRFDKQTLVTGADKLKTQVESLNAQLDAVQSELTRTNAEVAGVRDLSAKLQASTPKLVEAKAKAEAQLKDLSAKLQASAQRLSEAKAGAESKVKELEEKLQASTSQLSQARAEANAAADACAKDLEAKLQALSLQIRIKTAVAHQRFEAAVRLQRELFAAKHAHSACQAEKSACQARLDAILQSSSWRVTRPVRSIVTQFRRLLGTN